MRVTTATIICNDNHDGNLVKEGCSADIIIITIIIVSHDQYYRKPYRQHHPLISTLDIKLSGKVASSRIDLTDGNVKAVMFGDWSLNIQSVNRADFYADFTIHNTTSNLLNENMDIIQRDVETNQTETMISFKVGHLRLTSFQRMNDELSLRGTTNIMAAISSSSSSSSSLSTAENNKNNITLASELEDLPNSWDNVKTTITIIQNRIIIINFDEGEQKLNKIFGNLPIIGVVVA